ncbi:mitochondrial dynamics protein MID51 [Striga asiatica]|uniref:Mitochondrial dynamics protein MID51 n=1 Tax=Striga asiatica TaxID=4170 RepID=A0A5A7NY27_STRAF|nr:mitochondrial dynamics protein MID51 [Striga asiatica]
MDIYNSNGLSWADQWDPEPLPSERPNEKEKSRSDKNKAGKKILNLKWVKNICKKSKNNVHKVEQQATINKCHIGLQHLQWKPCHLMEENCSLQILHERLDSKFHAVFLQQLSEYIHITVPLEVLMNIPSHTRRMLMFMATKCIVTHSGSEVCGMKHCIYLANLFQGKSRHRRQRKFFHIYRSHKWGIRKYSPILRSTLNN